MLHAYTAALIPDMLSNLIPDRIRDLGHADVGGFIDRPHPSMSEYSSNVFIRVLGYLPLRPT